MLRQIGRKQRWSSFVQKAQLAPSVLVEPCVQH